MSRKIIVALACLASFALWVVLKPPVTDPRPQSRDRPTLDSLLNVHGSPVHTLSVCGKKFSGVRGASPFILSVSNTSLLIFCYEPKKGAPSLVICDTNDCSFREIALTGLGFGERIGLWEKSHGQIGDVVESVSSNEVVLLSRSHGFMERSVLRLEPLSIRAIETKNNHSLVPADIWTNSP